MLDKEIEEYLSYNCFLEGMELDQEILKLKNNYFGLSSMNFIGYYKILELENLFSIDINSSIDEEVDTVGGLVFFIANKVPKVNEVFKLNNKIRFKVLKADERRIKTLEISKII